MPIGVGLNQATGAVYVSEEGSHKILQFNTTGEAAPKSEEEMPDGAGYEVAVDNNPGSPSYQDVYVATEEVGVVYKYKTKAGKELEADPTELLFPKATGVAVNVKGDVYIASEAEGRVGEFSPTGKPINESLITGLVEPLGLAVNGSGDIYVATTVGTFEYESHRPMRSARQKHGRRPQCRGRLRSNVFVSDSTQQVVHEYGPGAHAAILNPELEEGTFDYPYGLAIANTSHTLYLAQLGGTTINIYNRAATGEALTINKDLTNEGEGTVTSEPSGIGCGETCSHEFTKGEKVKLTATPAAGSEFVEWSGGGCSGKGKCEVTMSAPVEVTATFNKIPLPKFLLTASVTGEGEVTSAGTIKCKEGGSAGECTEDVEEGTTIELQATAELGWTLHEWSTGPCKGTKVATCKFAMPAEAVDASAVFVESHTFPLTVFVTGDGEVTSAGTIKCKEGGSAGECEEQAEGITTLTAEVGPGSVFAGWIGCKKATATECKVDVTAASEVTAVFLKEGVEGTEGPQGTQGPPGPQGKAGKEGTDGKAGASGAAGEKGASGAAGPAGAVGPAGAQGPAGPAGEIELVTCKKVGKKEKCTTKLVSGTVKFTASAAKATLSRHGVVYAAGIARDVHGKTSLRLLAVRKLEPGAYALTLVSGSGLNERIRTEKLTVK